MPILKAIAIYFACAVVALVTAALAIYLDVWLHTGPFIALAAGFVLGWVGLEEPSSTPTGEVTR